MDSGGYGAAVHLYVLPTQSFLSCQICGGLLFARREVKMTTTGMTFFDLDWLNKSAEGAICVRCGYVHTFMQVETLQWLAPEAVDPKDLPRDRLADLEKEQG